jgi:hypothetical protein
LKDSVLLEANSLRAYMDNRSGEEK